MSFERNGHNSSYDSSWSSIGDDDPETYPDNPALRGLPLLEGYEPNWQPMPATPLPPPGSLDVSSLIDEDLKGEEAGESSHPSLPANVVKIEANKWPPVQGSAIERLIWNLTHLRRRKPSP